MPSIITNSLRSYNAANFEEAFLETSPDDLYIFLGRTTAWTDEDSPDTPIDSPKQKLRIYDEIVGMKKVSTADIVPVIKRNDWQINTIYDEYDDEVEIVGGIDPSTGNPYRYYVMTDNFDVYKCISNNNESLSTVKPTGTSITSFETVDGYIWKYMFTVSTNNAINYLSSAYIPLRTLKENDNTDQWLVQTLATDGSIEHIILESAGLEYDPQDPPLITITGDGSGATAEAVIEPTTGAIEKIIMTDIGSDYSFATVVVDNTDVPGSGALARAVISPLGGHGSDPQKELGDSLRMVTVSFDGDEGGNLPLDVEYRQIGMILNPFRLTTGTLLKVSSITGKFDGGDVITGGSSAATGTVVKYMDSDGFIYINVTSGSFNSSETISSVGGAGTIYEITNNVNLPAVEQFVDADDLLKGSGEIVYVNNRTRVIRFAEQEERAKLIITF